MCCKVEEDMTEHSRGGVDSRGSETKSAICLKRVISLSILWNHVQDTMDCINVLLFIIWLLKDRRNHSSSSLVVAPDSPYLENGEFDGGA